MTDKCPVDHSSRQAWLDKAKETQEAKCPVDHGTQQAFLDKAEACSSDRLDSYSNQDLNYVSGELSKEREVSSIPRHGTGKNWVYPSQQQFFNAMKRKNFDPDGRDMQTIIPIHNAVNERAWMEILKWEEGRGGDQCGGPQLIRFEGNAKKLTPNARWNMVWGLQKPFDRHDWVVDRCGTQVEYVIDFYTGKANPMFPDMPSFYIDARPKLNTMEGVKMRVAKWFGI
jgi:cytochrome c heme-lyase